MVFIPAEKVDMAVNLIQNMLQNKKKKTTIRQLQQLTGTLNFFSRCIVPARMFTRRLYAKMTGYNLKPHHHIRVDQEMRADLQIWLQFLNNPAIYARPFADFSTIHTALDIDMYTDSSGKIGCGGKCKNQWFAALWPTEFLEQCDPSINYLELYAVTVAIISWVHQYRNMSIALFCDNLSVVNMINNASSSCRNCMRLLRIITIYGLNNNVRISAKHVSGVTNIIPDLFSRNKINQCFEFCRRHHIEIDQHCIKMPAEFWPPQKKMVSLTI